MPDRVIQSLIDAIALPALAIGTDERIAAANAGALTLLGRGLVGRSFVAMLRQPMLLEAIEGTLRDAQPRTTRYLSNDGAQDTTYEVSCRAAGAAEAVVVCFSDVTAMEQAGQMRRDFVANVSHELRTPLTALIGFIETLQGPAKDDRAARVRFLDIMQAEAGRMNRLVGDLLSLSRVESDERVRPTGTTSLTGILQSTLRALQPLAADADVNLTLNAPETPVTLPADEDQLRQVFTNLIENGIKYGGSGGCVTVTLTVSPRDPALRAPGARVDVTDNGPGIDAAHLPRLTERFYRVDGHRSRTMGGTGLGLAIVKHIINRHRGRLRVVSTPGQGATFSVILPLAEGSASETPQKNIQKSNLS